MNTRWLFAAGYLYKSWVKKITVLTVCIEVYSCGYINALEDNRKQMKKSFLKNIANMAQSTCIGVTKGVIFPIYLPASVLYINYKR